jgi:hypothetical protein
VRALPVLVLAIAACQPLYGNPPERMPKVSKKSHKEEPPVPPPPIKYIEDCTASFRDDPKRAPPAQPIVAKKLEEDADKVMTDAKAKPTQLEQGQTVATAVDKYSNALRKDPYNAEITLRLALAYDAVYRKGCALVLLKRIAAMSKNPSVSPNAEAIAASVEDNNAWFKGYRKEALAALAR